MPISPGMAIRVAKCPDCGREYLSHETLRDHVRSAHGYELSSVRALGF